MFWYLEKHTSKVPTFQRSHQLLRLQLQPLSIPLKWSSVAIAFTPSSSSHKTPRSVVSVIVAWTNSPTLCASNFDSTPREWKKRLWVCFIVLSKVFSVLRCISIERKRNFPQALFTRAINVTIFVPFKNGLNTVSRYCLHIKYKKIKHAAHKNGEIDGTCKRGLSNNIAFAFSFRGKKFDVWCSSNSYLPFSFSYVSVIMLYSFR